MIIISGYAIDKFNSSLSEAGLSASIFVIGSLAGRLFCGKWLELIGYKQTLYVGVILGFVMTFAYFCSNSISLLLIVRFMHGAGFGIITTTTASIVTLIVPQERSGEGIGYYGLSQILSTALGPFIGMFLGHHGSYDTIFIVCTVISAGCLLIAPFISLPISAFSNDQLNEMNTLKFGNFFEMKVFPISLIIMLTFIGYSSVISFIAVYSQKIDLVNAAGFFFVIYAAIILISRPFTGRLFDVKGENSIMYPGIILFTVGMVLFSQAYRGYMLLFAAVLIGIGVGTIQPSTQAIAVKLVPRHRIGLANSTYFALADIGMGIGPIISGYLIRFTDYRGMYMVISIIGAFCLPLYFLVHGKSNGARL